MQTSTKLKWSSLGAGAAAFLLLLVLFFFSPEQFHFYPTCPLYAWTGLQCPGCGGLRATHCLLHGDIERAFNFNPFFVSLLPLALIWGSGQITELSGGRNFARFLHRPLIGWSLLAAMVVFTIVRNLPKFS